MPGCALAHIIHFSSLCKLLSCSINWHHVLPGLKGPSPVNPKNSCAGSGPESPGSTSPAFPAYQDIPLGSPRCNSVSQGSQGLGGPLLPSQAFRISRTHLCKYGKLRFPLLPRYVPGIFRMCLSKQGNLVKYAQHLKGLILYGYFWGAQD